MKEIKIVQRGHGYFKGGVFEKDICPTIDCHISCQHVLIMEIEKNGFGNDSKLEKPTKPIGKGFGKE